MPLAIFAFTGCVSGHAPSSAGSTQGGAGFDSVRFCGLAGGLAGGVFSMRLAGGFAALALGALGASDGVSGVGASGTTSGVVPGIGSHGSVAGPSGSG